MVRRTHAAHTRTYQPSQCCSAPARRCAPHAHSSALLRLASTALLPAPAVMALLCSAPSWLLRVARRGACTATIDSMNRVRLRMHYASRAAHCSVSPGARCSVWRRASAGRCGGCVCASWWRRNRSAKCSGSFARRAYSRRQQGQASHGGRWEQAAHAGARWRRLRNVRVPDPLL